jgi:Zn-dependent peptidase ImmA (M78 family)
MALTYTLARRKAKELLRNANIVEAPVPVEELVNHVGARIRMEPFDGEVSGLVYRQKSGRPVIGVNSMHSITRQRFTIAHELAHLVLHKNEELHVDEHPPIRFRDKTSSRAVDRTEIEANQFAAELLMPYDFLTREINQLPDGIPTEEGIRLLAERFIVSEQAMTFRLSGLGLLH